MNGGVMKESPKRTVTREELFEQVWQTPMTQLAKEYGISDVGLAKVCKRLEVPRPPRGYWRKLEVGRAPPKPKLKALTKHGIDSVVITPVADAYPASPLKGEIPEEIPVPTAVEEPHRLTQKTQVALEKGKADEKGLIQPRNKICLDVAVTRDQIDRACRVMDAIVKVLEARGYPVTVAGDPKAKTTVSVDGESFEFGIDEKVGRSDHLPTKEERARYGTSYWMIPKYDYEPTGLLFLRIRNAPYGCRQQWADGKRQKIEDCLGEFVLGLRAAAQREKELREERRLREIARAEEQKRQAELERLARLEKMRIEKLTNDVGAWELANRIRGYIQELQKQSDAIEGLAEWIEWAKGYADELDPLSRPDELGFHPRSPYYY
jgi:hypothetical protein